LKNGTGKFLPGPFIKMQCNFQNRHLLKKKKIFILTVDYAYFYRLVLRMQGGDNAGPYTHTHQTHAHTNTAVSTSSDTENIIILLTATLQHEPLPKLHTHTDTHTCTRTQTRTQHTQLIMIVQKYLHS